MAASTSPRSLTLLFFALALLLCVANVAAEDGFANSPRQHKRMIKKRIPALSDITGFAAPANGPANVGSTPGGVGNVGEAPSGNTTETASGASASPSATSSALPSATSAAASSPSLSATSSGGLLDTSSKSLAGTQTSTTLSATSTGLSATSASATSTVISLTSASPSASSAAPTSASASASSPGASAPTSAAPASAPPASKTKEAQAASGPVTQTIVIQGSAPTTDPNSNTASAATKSTPATIAKKTIIIIVAIAGSLGLAFLIWTGIRKWKFKPSSRFDERMAPIDWQPTHDIDDPAEKVAAHSRTGSHGSFGSSDLAHGAQGASGVSRSVSGHSVQRTHDDYGVPAHDFTAGPADFAPGPAYADLQRGGAPPQNLMVENGLNRGPSMTRAPMDDPYGGYSDYDTQASAPQHAYNANAYGPQQQPQDHGYGAPYRGY